MNDFRDGTDSISGRTRGCRRGRSPRIPPHMFHRISCIVLLVHTSFAYVSQNIENFRMSYDKGYMWFQRLPFLCTEILFHTFRNLDNKTRNLSCVDAQRCLPKPYHNQDRRLNCSRSYAENIVA